jgi:hypothetical protein
VRPGQVASIARARLIAEQEESAEDGPEAVIASQLLQDKDLGLLFHQRLIDSKSFEPTGKPFRDEGQ